MAWGNLAVLTKVFANYSAQIGMLPSFVLSLLIVVPITEIRFSSRRINAVSKATLCAYLIHQFPALLPTLIWDKFFHVDYMATKGTFVYFLYLIFVVIIIYLAAMILNAMTAKLSEKLAQKIYSSSRLLNEIE